MTKGELASRLRSNPLGRRLLKNRGLGYIVRLAILRLVSRATESAPTLRRTAISTKPEFAPRRLVQGLPTKDYHPDWLPAWARKVYDNNAHDRHRDLYGLRVKDAKVIGRHGWVQTPEGEVFDDLWSWIGHPSTRFDESAEEYAKTVVQKLPGVSAVLACPWAGNYWHFALQSLPRVKLVRDYLEGQEPDHYIIQKAKAPFVAELLGYAGVDPARVVELWSESVECEAAIATTIPCEDVYVPRWIADYLREIVPTIPTEDAPERLFVTRGAVGGRDIANADALTELIRRYGFRETSMDGLSVAQQAALFRSAKVVLAVHGAALTNLVYCDPGALIIELTSSNYAWAAYHRLATTMELDYYQVIGTEIRQPAWMYRLEQGADMVVDLDQVETILKKHGGSES